MTASVEGRAALLHGGNTGQDGALSGYPAYGLPSPLFGVNDSPRSATGLNRAAPPSFASCAAAFSADRCVRPVVNDIERAAVAAEG